MSEQHDWVRRLLAESGDSPEPMPADVADRLDRVLAGLADSPRAARDEDAVDEPVTRPAEASSGGEVVPMTRRRRRRWGAALLAAAAVTVGGYTVTATGVLDDLTGADAGSASSADAESAADEPASAEEGPPEPQDDAREGAGSTLPRVPSLSSATLRRDASELARATGSDVAALRAQGSGETADEARSPTPARASCVPPPAGVRGTRLRVTYDGQRATAVLRPAAAGRTLVQVWACDAPVRLARVAVSR